MADEEQPEETAESTEAPKEEAKPKESFWARAKNSLSKAVLEDKLNAAYRNAHAEYSYYTYGNDSVFGGSTVYGTLSDNVLTYLSDAKIPVGSIIIDEKTEKAYLVASERSDAEVTIPLEGQEYTRKGSSIKLDPEVTEVKVIKAGKRYFLYKE